ncbi:hypothetical protein [Algoriphagus sp. NG3]|uniref:thermonuclease family protein n=1 Tax=Algoriphagus sp. NG3 TaxID=3097546 RepID=UPI002A81024A|nr:hypothetical protein [Algoriphagus sp. NG3]WPR77950.1 hypothetical protein SLW71_11400 [Algoriphagus sp. NG3]
MIYSSQWFCHHLVNQIKKNPKNRIYTFSFWVKIDAGKNKKIRLIGVDTPEVKWEGLAEEQPGGKEASEYVKQLVLIY